MNGVATFKPDFNQIADIGRKVKSAIQHTVIYWILVGQSHKRPRPVSQCADIGLNVQLYIYEKIMYQGPAWGEEVGNLFDYSGIPIISSRWRENVVGLYTGPVSALNFPGQFFLM
jgi:hypothetical protein